MIYEKLVNFDRLVNQLREPPLIVNDLINYSEDDRKRIDDLIMTNYSSDMVSILPQCQCGHIKGEYAIGTTCSVCGTKVTSITEGDMDPLIWCRAPEGVAKLINPAIWTMLRRRFRKSGWNVMQWLCDTSYTSPDTVQPKVIAKILSLGVQRGYNNFVEHFDLIMDTLFSMDDFKPKKNKTDHLYSLIKLYRDCIFSDYLPLPNRSILIVEKTNVGRYVDNNALMAISAIRMLTSIDAPDSGFTVRVKENRTVRAICILSEFYEDYIKNTLASHNGQFRRHFFGTRIDFSFRAVITSLTDAHSYDEIHIPWGCAVSTFRPFLINKLLARGFDLNSAVGFLLGHVRRYSEVLDQIFKELIAESPEGKIPCFFQRNPSLLQGSMQLMGITHVKPDVTDNTVSVPILVVRAPNA